MRDPSRRMSAMHHKADSRCRHAIDRFSPEADIQRGPKCMKGLYRDDEASGRAYTHHATGMIITSRTA
jgi:hypothetical protein